MELRGIHTMLEVARCLPKVELHAHLSGSVRASTLKELSLAAGDGVIPDIHKVLDKPGRDLNDCFSIFAAIHKVLTTPDVIKRVAREVIDDFAADNVKYLELRTTPRAVPGSMTVAEYMEALLEAIRETTADITVTLLLSVNRAEPLAKAAATVSLAIEKGYPVVGIDFSGNPNVGKFADFAPEFQRARAAGLFTSVHTAEVMDPEDTAAVLAFKPDRLGHMCVLTPKDKATLLAGKSIPIELCITSNELTLELGSPKHHPTLATWIEEGYPFALCTDDSGVFDVTLSQEMAKAADTCGMSPDDLAAVATRAARFVFAPDATREALFRRLEHESAPVVEAAMKISK